MNTIPTVVKNLLIINLLVFFGCYVTEMRGINLTGYCGLFYFDSPYFNLWQPLTYMFLHGGLMHIFFNMFALWMFGRVLEEVWGAHRFLIYYMVCGLGAAFTQELVQHITLQITTDIQTVQSVYFSPTIGASGAIYGILLAYGRMFPDNRLFVFPIPMPIKAKWFVIIFIVIELFEGLAVNDNVAHFAHLGGMIFGYLLISYWTRPRIYQHRANHKSKLRMHSRVKDAEIIEESVGHDEASDREMAAILNKIKQSGYDALTSEEKRKLFESNNK